MEQNVGQLALICVATTAVNTVNAAQSGKDIVTPLVAGGVTFAGLSFVGQLWRWDIVNAIALIFLFSAFVTRGLPLISGVVDISQGRTKSKTETKAKPAFGGGGGSF